MSELETKKSAALQEAIKAIKKQFGDGSILTDKAIPGIQFLRTGSRALDEAMGGGWARGRLHEIYGPESSGKTTLALHAIAEAQKTGGVCAFIDAEHALDVNYAKALGVQTDKLLISQPDNGEQALEITETLVRSGAVEVVVIDSVAALVPQKELEGEMGDAQMGLQARLMSQAMRKLAGAVHVNNATVIFINQIRMKLGVMFGNPETVSGGNALKFYASQRLDIRRREAVKEGTGDDAVIIGNKTDVKVVKNKVAPPFREATFTIKYGIGIDQGADLLEAAVATGVVDKSGAWYSFEGQKIGQGEDKVLETLRENQELRKKIDARVTEVLR